MARATPRRIRSSSSDELLQDGGVCTRRPGRGGARTLSCLWPLEDAIRQVFKGAFGLKDSSPPPQRQNPVSGRKIGLILLTAKYERRHIWARTDGYSSGKFSFPPPPLRPLPLSHHMHRLHFCPHPGPPQPHSSLEFFLVFWNHVRHTVFKGRWYVR